jgi:hypothetical protein
MFEERPVFLYTILPGFLTGYSSRFTKITHWFENNFMVMNLLRSLASLVFLVPACFFLQMYTNFDRLPDGENRRTWTKFSVFLDMSVGIMRINSIEEKKSQNLKCLTI